MAAESLDALKRWREERWDRRADRARLRAPADADARPAAAPRRGRRNAISRWIRPWPAATLSDLLHGSWNESSLESPVHPEWDDPGGKRISRSLGFSLLFNLIAAPLILVVMDFRLPEPSSQTHLKPYIVTFSAPKGNSLTAPRSPLPPAATAAEPRPVTPPVTKPEPPREAPPKPVPPKPEPPKPADPGKAPAKKPVDEPRSAEARAKADDGHRVRETADPTQTTPVPAREKGTSRAGEGLTRQAAPAAEPPVTEPVAQAGPLVASVAGPVVGSELSLGDLDGVDFPHSYYLEQIRDKIAQRWGPPEGMARGRQLKAVVRFRILRSGKIGEQVLEEPSGHTVFDQAALRAVTDAQKFGPLPEAFPGAFLVVHFNFTYTSP